MTEGLCRKFSHCSLWPNLGKFELTSRNFDSYFGRSCQFLLSPHSICGSRAAQRFQCFRRPPIMSLATMRTPPATSGDRCSLLSHAQEEVGNRLSARLDTAISAIPLIRSSDSFPIVTGLRISHRMPSRRLVRPSERSMQHWSWVSLGSAPQCYLCTVGELLRGEVGETF